MTVAAAAAVTGAVTETATIDRSMTVAAAAVTGAVTETATIERGMTVAAAATATIEKGMVD